MSSQTVNSRKIPDNAPDRPENVVLDRKAWVRMWLENSNTIWTIVGDTGDGKSYASLRIAERIWPDFSVDEVTTNIIDFLRKVNDDSYGRGSVVVLEEASVEASAYDWHSESNRVFAHILDTWRHQNRMGIINLPNFDKLEKGARQRTEIIVNMQFAKPWMDYSQAKLYEPNTHNVTGDRHYPHPVIDNRKRKFMRFKMPSQSLIDGYEEKKENYTDELNEQMLEQLLESEREEEKKRQTPRDIANEIIDEGKVEKYISENHGQQYIDRDMIELDYDIGDGTSKKVKKVIVNQTGVDVL